MALVNDDNFDFLFKIVLIGDCGTGKTCVVQRFKNGTYVERHGNTIGVDFSMKTLTVDSKHVKVSYSPISIHYFFDERLILVANLGYCWSGKVSHHHTKLL